MPDHGAASETQRSMAADPLLTDTKLAELLCPTPPTTPASGPPSSRRTLMPLAMPVPTEPSSEAEALLPGAMPPLTVGLKVHPLTRGLVAVVEGEGGGKSDRVHQVHENAKAAAAAGVPLWMTIENSMAWKWFKELDDDQSGVLDEQEAKKLCAQLNLKIKRFDEVFKELDADGSGSVAFSEFVTWFNERKTSERREMRLEIRDLFDKIDKDRSGKLSKDEIRTLVKKSKGKLNLVEPAFEIEADWEAMQKTGGEVTFPHFENWWKDRSGIVDVSIPVLPEFMVSRIAEVGDRKERSGIHDLNVASLVDRIKPSLILERRWQAAKQREGETSDLERPESETARLLTIIQREVDDAVEERARDVLISMLMEQKGVGGVHYHRTGKELWAYLRPRLRFIVELQREWGNIHSLYPAGSESIYEDVPLPPRIRDPDSSMTGCWDLVGLVLLLSVSVLVPLRTCFEIKVEVLTAAWCYDLLCDVYFVVDLVLNFYTAFYDARGIREFRMHKIREHYLRGWFIIDFVSCLPVGYVTLIANALSNAPVKNLSDTPATNTSSVVEDEDSGSTFRAFKTLRLLRLAKMLRFFKVMKIFDKYAEALAMFMGVYMMLFCIFFAAHLLACFWYMMGTGVQVIPGVDGPVTGWVLNQEWDRPDEVPLSTKYATALYSVFNALESGNTDNEKYFAVFSELVVGFIFGALAGVMTQIMTSLKGNDQEFQLKLNGMRQWLKEQNFSNPEQKKVLAYFSEVWKTKTLFNEAEILGEMPPSMRNQLVQTLYRPVISEIPLFKGLADEIIAGLCLSAHPMVAIKNQEIMTEGLPGREMFMLLQGEVEVTRAGKRLGFLSDGSFFGENPVLANGEGTEIRSRSVIAVTECKLCYLTKDNLTVLTEEYPAFKFRLRRFRRLGRSRNKRNIARLGYMSLADDEKTKMTSIVKAEHAKAEQAKPQKGAGLKKMKRAVKVYGVLSSLRRTAKHDGESTDQTVRRRLPTAGEAKPFASNSTQDDSTTDTAPSPPHDPVSASRPSPRLASDARGSGMELAALKEITAATAQMATKAEVAAVNAKVDAVLSKLQQILDDKGLESA